MRSLLAASVFPKAAAALELCVTEGFEEALKRFPKVKAVD